MPEGKPWLAFYGDVPPSLRYPDRTLYQALRATAERCPEAPAWEFFGRTSTYRAFLAEVDHFAAALASLGVKEGDRLTIAMPTCPQGVIRIVTHRGGNNMYEVDTLEVDSGYCIHCGLCVEACPYNAIFMGYIYERARYKRGDLVMQKDDMAIEHEKASGYFHPELAQELPEQELLVYREKKK